jgi:hypothetical protein
VQGSRVTPKNIADHIRRVLKDGGSAPHAEEVQRFFKEEVQSRGWYTAEVRKLAVRFRRSILKERGQDFLLEVADDLFSGNINEERSLAVYLLQPLTANFGQSEFRRFEGWLTRISNWSDHDALVYYLLGPMIVARPERVSLGQGEGSLAPAGGLCCPDSGDAAKNVLRGDYAAHPDFVVGHRRHGTEGAGVVAERDCQVQRTPGSAVFA